MLSGFQFGTTVIKPGRIDDALFIPKPPGR